MKSFKNFLSEDYELPLAHITPDGAHEEFVTKNLKNKETLDGINVQLLRATFGQFSNPWQPLISISKLLATYGIQIPKAYFPAVDGGELIWSVASSGQLSDYNPSVPATNMTPTGFYVYFEYETDDTGAYIAYAEVVDEAGLSGLMEDLDEDVSESLLDRMRNDPKKKEVEARNAASKSSMDKALAAISGIKSGEHTGHEEFAKQKDDTRKTDKRLLKNVKARHAYHSPYKF